MIKTKAGIYFCVLFIFFLGSCAPLRYFKNADQGFIQTTKEKVKHFQLKHARDTIDFIVLSDDFDKKKPVLFYLQGSTPVPLIYDYKSDDMKALLVFSFLKDETVKKLKEKYHLVAISMPAVPLSLGSEDLNEQAWHVKQKDPYPLFYPEYHAANVLSNYVKRTNRVIDYLSNQSWVDQNHITLFGHSQGAKVAIVAASGNKQVYKVGFSGGNPFGTIDDLLREHRYNAMMGDISYEQSQKSIDSFYRLWIDIVANPKTIEDKSGDANRTWLSFDENLVPYFLKTKQPIYVCYGTVDPKSVMCDNLPIYFIRAKKTNLTMKPYPGLQHNYRPVDEKLKIAGESIMDSVIMDFTKWDFK